MNQSYQDLVILLARGISQRKMYSEDHPKVQACAREFCDNLTRLQMQDHKTKFFIGVVNGKLVHEGKFLIGPSIIGSRLNVFAKMLECGGFLFNQGLTIQEVKTFFTLASQPNKSWGSLTEARQLLKSKKIANIELSPPYEDPGWFGQFLFDEKENMGLPEGEGEDWEKLLPAFQSLYSTLETAHDSGHSGRSLDLNAARGSTEKLLQAIDGPFTDIMQLVRYPDYDTYTVGHSVRVAMFAVIVGRHLNLPKSIQNEMGVAALLHDVGKSRIPAEILFKPGRLDERERAVIEEHAEIGARMLMESGGASEMTIAVAWGHHRRFDGKGYPAMVLGSHESPVTQIINVCDVFEALTAIRPYKQAHTARKAYEIMLSQPGWFCPNALSSFCAAVGLYPPGSMVKLTSGHRAQVMAPGELFDRPKIKLSHNPDGQKLEDSDQAEIDLSTHRSKVAVEDLLVFK
jgi:putative nucleotidyltransferase with HDIG domain